MGNFRDLTIEELAQHLHVEEESIIKQVSRTKNIINIEFNRPLIQLTLPNKSTTLRQDKFVLLKNYLEVILIKQASRYKILSDF